MNNIIMRISESKHAVVIAHIHPDADSLGGASALYSYMLQLHKKVTFFCATKEIDIKFNFLPWINKIKNKISKDADLAICVDCGDKTRIGVTLDIELINFDHHKSNDLYAQYNIVDSHAISTTQVIYNFFKQNNIKINTKMATALYTGLLDDSSNFLSTKTNEEVFLMAAELCHLNADINLVSNFISKRVSLSAFRLKGAMIKDIVLLNNAKIALLLVTQEMLHKYGAKVQDCEAVLQEGLFLPTVLVSLLLCEQEDLSIKGSLRSKGETDVDMIAGYFGGGGHFHSAGFMIKDKNLQEASSQVMEKLSFIIKEK